jgi:hypothetical protein
MSNIKPTIYPTFVLGIGGTGKNVVRHVKRRLLSQFGRQSGEELPSLFQVLAVDTEPLVNQSGSQPLYFHEYAFMGHFDATKLVQNRKQHAPFLDWWNWENNELNLGYIHNGAKQLRPVGRLCFFRNYDVFRSAVQSKLRNIQKANAIAEAEEDLFPVQTNMKLIYIVSSVCGGTGAGMLVDAARCVRDYVGEDAKIIGVLAMPSVFVEEIQSEVQRRRIHANAYAVLKELDYFQTNTTAFRQLYPNEDHEIPGTAIKPFDQVFLVEMTDDRGTALTNKESIEKMIAHFIQLTNLSDISDHVLSMDANIHEMAYSAFGVSALVLPRENLDGYFAEAAIASLANEFEVRGSSGALQIDDAIKQHVAGLANSESWTEDKLEQLGKDFAAGKSIWPEVRKALHDAVRALVRSGGWAAAHDELKKYADRTDREIERAAANPKSVEAGFRIGVWGFTPPVLAKEAHTIRTFVDSVLNPEGARTDKKNRSKNKIFNGWQTALTELAKRLVAECRSYIDRIEQYIDAAKEVRHDALKNFDMYAKTLSPKEGSSQTQKQTHFYDLETPALGRLDLPVLEQWAANAINSLKDVPVERKGADGRTATVTERRPWRTVVIGQLYRDLFDELTNAASGERFTALQMRERIVRNNDFKAWRTLADQSFDIRKVYGSRLDRQPGSQPRPNNRANQLHARASLHADIDREMHNFAGANPEPLRIVSAYRPSDDRDDDFELTLKEHGDFKAVNSRDKDRMDACYILHGIPGSQIRGLETLYHAYWGDDSVLQHKHLVGAFDARRFHLSRTWAVQLPELFPDSLDSRAMNRKAEYAREDADRAAAAAAAAGSATPPPDPRTSSRRGTTA